MASGKKQINNSIPIRLDRKVILITGGYGYLGKAIVNSLCYHGAAVIVGGKKESEFLKIFTPGSSLSFIEMDVSDSQSINKAIIDIYTRYGKIDVLINNAFYSIGQSPENMTDDEWNTGIEGTLGSVFKCIRAIIPLIKKQGMGKIINVSSMYGMVSPDFEIYQDFESLLNPPHYGAAKAGILQLTRYYANYLGKYGVQVNSITPGPFPSEEVQKKTQFIERLAQKTALGQIAKPEDLAGAFVFLSSDAANFITGQNIIVDGGWTSK
jgi:NAD(P)-dependent dehydrogenase (short-subunit alcohol dehydrogenase family)